MLKDTSWHLLAAVCSHGVLIRCLRFWTSLLDDQSVLSLKDTSSRSLCGPTNDVEPKDTVAKTNTRSRVLRPPSAMKI